MAEEGHNSEFLAHTSFLTLMIPDRIPGLRRHISYDADTVETNTSSNEGGIINTVKSYLGLDDKTVASIQDSAASTADAYLPESLKPAGVKGAAGAYTTTGTTDATETSTVADPSTDSSTALEPSTDKTEDTAAVDPSTDKSEDTTAVGTSTDKSEDTSVPAPTKEKTTTGGDDTTTAPSGGDGADNTEAEETEKSEDKPSSGGDSTGNSGKKRENPEAIPTAGGQKLGEEHWGESKIVPDNPKPTEETAVASEAGQPTEEVKANTAQNVGTATGGPGAESDVISPTQSESGEKKGKFMDKLKSKFKKDKA